MNAPARDYPMLPGRKPKPIAHTPENCARVKANMGLAWLAAKQAWGRGGHKGVLWEDVLSASTYALWRCAAAFDPARGFKFSTLAYKPCFRAAVQIIQVDSGRKKRIRAIALGENRQLSMGGPRDLLCGLVEAEERAERINWVRLELEAFSDRDRAILDRRITDEWTLEEIAHAFDLTRERVRQICAAALMRLTERYLAARAAA
jgi:RNA polymerase sigma factor (sigma-70 family)